MFKITWDKETGGVLLSSKVTNETLGYSPRPVWYEELDLLGLDKLGWKYPHTEAPLLWAINRQYFYRGELVMEAKGANIYDAPTLTFTPGYERLDLEPVDVEKMLERNADLMFLLESEAIDFIRDTYSSYSRVNKTYEKASSNQLDFEALAQQAEKHTKQKMAVVKEDCDSFDVMPLDTATKEGKKVVLSTKIDRFIASFSGGKDSQVVLDLCTRAIPPTDFEVIYSDTGYELPPSLELYEQVKKYYGERFPALKFSTTRNHESVLTYWDKIGTPSDTHRWCCSVMKTAPLYRSLKVDGNRQAKVLTFDGVRAEESVRRSGYNRIGKGKHVFTYNAHPILNWNVAEIFLYMMIHDLPNNQAYRFGFSRVGCVICPFGSDWSDFLVSKLYSESRLPFLNKLQTWVIKSGIKDADNYVKTRRWRISALGSEKINLSERVSVSLGKQYLTLQIECLPKAFFEWMKVLGEYTIRIDNKSFCGEIKLRNNVISFNGVKSAKGVIINFNTADKTFLNEILRVANKAAFCVECEVCEVECPTGALQIIPNLSIGSQCIHCLKCIMVHEKGCIAADCIRKIAGKINMEKTSLSIKGYKTFGLRDEWIDEYVCDPENFWSSTLLGSAMFDSFKNWTKDAGLLDTKNKITPFGELMMYIYRDNATLFWEIVWINLSYSSFIVNRFVNEISQGETFDKKYIVDIISSKESVSSLATLNNAAMALMDMFKHSPIGEDLLQGDVSGNKRIRRSYDDISPEALAYSLYKYAEYSDTKEFRIADLYKSEEKRSVALEFATSKNALIKKLRSLSAETNRILIAELNMGLDHITLFDEFDSFSILKMVVG